MPPSGPVRPISTPRSRRALTIASARSGPDVDARHQPPGPHLADAGQRVQARTQLRAALRRALDEALVLDHAQDGEAAAAATVLPPNVEK